MPAKDAARYSAANSSSVSANHRCVIFRRCGGVFGIGRVQMIHKDCDDWFKLIACCIDYQHRRRLATEK